jgi:hypothetical protein
VLVAVDPVGGDADVVLDGVCGPPGVEVQSPQGICERRQPALLTRRGRHQFLAGQQMDQRIAQMTALDLHDAAAV